MDDKTWVGLADGIAELRAQLSVARARALGEEVLFSVGKAEIELEIAVRYEAGAGGGVKFGIVSLEGRGSRSSGSANRLRLELTPHDPSGGDIDVSSQVHKLPDR